MAFWPWLNHLQLAALVGCMKRQILSSLRKSLFAIWCLAFSWGRGEVASFRLAGVWAPAKRVCFLLEMGPWGRQTGFQGGKCQPSKKKERKNPFSINIHLGFWWPAGRGFETARAKHFLADFGPPLKKKGRGWDLATLRLFFSEWGFGENAPGAAEVHFPTSFLSFLFRLAFQIARMPFLKRFFPLWHFLCSFYFSP